MENQAIEELADKVRSVLSKNRDSLPVGDVLLLEESLEILEELKQSAGNQSPMERLILVAELMMRFLDFFGALVDVS